MSHCEQSEKIVTIAQILRGQYEDVSATAAIFENLNPEQRRAVEHGAVEPAPSAPLLVHCGTGSGKTNTLAHRVAHLIVNGVDFF